MNKVIEEYDGKIHFVEIDIDADPDIARDALVVGTPTVQFFKNKELVEVIQGVKQKSIYRQAIERYARA